MRTGEVRYEAFQMSELPLADKVYHTVHWCNYDWQEKKKSGIIAGYEADVFWTIAMLLPLFLSKEKSCSWRRR